VTQETAGLVHPAFGHEAPDPGAADHELLVPYRVDLLRADIIIVNLALAGGLMSVLQPFAALYVLILASASPLLAKESERIYDLAMRLFEKRDQPPGEEAEEMTAAVKGE
jgi:hypothetical protein